jgi:hypothetical protein
MGIRNAKFNGLLPPCDKFDLRGLSASPSNIICLFELCDFDIRGFGCFNRSAISHIRSEPKPRRFVWLKSRVLDRRLSLRPTFDLIISFVSNLSELQTCQRPYTENQSIIESETSIQSPYRPL